MQNYAILQINNRQYIVEPGSTYTVDKFIADAGKKHMLPALAVSKEGKLQLPANGKPMLVEVEVVEQGLGEKIKTFVFKAKSRYRRRHGFRKQSTTFKVIGVK